MKFLYWTGGIPELESVVSLEKTVDVVEGKPDALILNDLLNQTALLTDPHDQSLFLYAETHFDKMYNRSIPELRQGNRDDWLKGIALNPEDQELYAKYQALVEQQHKIAGEQYAHARDIVGSLAEKLQVFIVPGRHDTAAIWDAFGERVLHIKATDVSGRSILGLGAIYEHSPDIAESLRIGAFDAGRQYASPEQLLERNAATDILVVNDFIEKQHDRRLESNTIDPKNKTAKLVNAFVAGDWAKDGLLRKKHKLVITPAASNAPNSEVSHMHGSVVLNAGLNQAHGYRAYLVDHGEQGVANITALGVGGRQSTPYSYDTIKEFPPISQEDLNVSAEQRIRDLEGQLRAERAKNAKRKAKPSEEPAPVPKGTVIGDDVTKLVYEQSPADVTGSTSKAPKPATPAEPVPVSPPKATTEPKAKPPKAESKAQKPEPAPETPETAPVPLPTPVRKPSKFELFVEHVWTALEDKVKKMPEAKQDALVAIKETLLDPGKHQERIKALESTIESESVGVAYYLVGGCRNTAETLIRSYANYLAKTGFAKKHPDDYKMLAKLATGLPAHYVNALQQKIREQTKDIGTLHKEMAKAERDYNTEIKDVKRAQKQGLSLLHQIKDKYDAAMAQLKKYEDELEQEDVYVLEDDTKVEERVPDEPDVDQIRSLAREGWYCIKRGQHKEAIGIYQRILQQEDIPLRLKAHAEYQLGIAYGRDFEFEESVTHLEKANAYCSQRGQASPEDKSELELLAQSAEIALSEAQRTCALIREAAEATTRS